jgi:hypothetical protein
VTGETVAVSVTGTVRDSTGTVVVLEGVTGDGRIVTFGTERRAAAGILAAVAAGTSPSWLSRRGRSWAPRVDRTDGR